MARTRAERRHNTHVKTSARKTAGALYCGNKIAPNGEAKSCSLCVTCLTTERHYNDMWMKAQTKAFMKAIAE